jgi:hypothetical protein
MIRIISGGAGSGDVIGPSSASDNAIVRYDTTSGKLVQSSVVTIDDTGIIAFPDNVRQTFNPGATVAGLNVGSQPGDPSTPINGDIWYDSTANTLDARVNGATINLGAGAGDALTTNPLSQFAPTTSGQLAGVITNETGTGSLVFGTSPTLANPIITGLAAWDVNTRQTFSPGSVQSGLNVGAYAGDPSSLQNADIWYDSSTNTFDVRINGATYSLGFLGIPPNEQSANYTLVLGDSGKSIDHPSTDANARTFTIPANGSVAFPVGTTVSFSNMTSQVVSIAITTDTMYLAGAGTTGTRSLAQYGTATARKLTSTTWLISGTGLT